MSKQMEEKKDSTIESMESSPWGSFVYHITAYAGKEIGNIVFEGKTLEEISEKYANDPKGKALWIKGAMERLDALVDEETRYGIMRYCGATCAGACARGGIDKAIEMRKKFDTIDEFLKANGFDGEVFHVNYSPHRDGKRCHCLGNDLPVEEIMSPTYCQCSVGHVKTFWEEVLERPVKVDLIHSAITGADECKFAVRLA